MHYSDINSSPPAVATIQCFGFLNGNFNGGINGLDIHQQDVEGDLKVGRLVICPVIHLILSYDGSKLELENLIKVFSLSRTSTTTSTC